jgi:hypothetical protein
MKSMSSRLKALEKKVEEQKNPLFQIRKDLSEIIYIKKCMDYQNRFNNSEHNSEVFFNGTKKEDAINDGVKAIKTIIIELAKKYQEELV